MKSVSKENYFFWKKLESDLKFSLPFYIKNVLQ